MKKTAMPSHTHRYRQWIESLPAAARGDAKHDLQELHDLLADPHRNVRVLVQATDDAFVLRIFSCHAQLTLAEMMPVVHSFRLEALREDIFHLPHKDGQVWLHVLTCANPSQPITPAMAEDLGTALAACLMRTAEVDSLNSLVRRGVPFKALPLLRALVAYAQQLDGRCNPWLVRKVLRHYPAVARHVWALFEAKHDPQIAPHARTKLVKQLDEQTRDVLAALPDVDHDRMASMLVGIVKASLRTNFWQGQGHALAIKVDGDALDEVAKPRPWREIFVYGENGDFAGVHLRGGPVARGGIRYSDRPIDFRTEVLGLQQTQVRKNVIIVPTGAKGGFVIHAPLPPHKGEAQTLIRHMYGAYIKALLSVTDNRVGEKVIPPRGVVCHDGADPYLVVAADKGTASFSDVANEIACAMDVWDMPKGHKGQGFWLGDAFASGGSKGYDHKHMGITSRGAWVSVMHHLKALEIEPSAKRPLVMAGIGDMSGDVFGNGLLLEPHVKLVAAFNHIHIFIDPTPDPKATYAERQRLFKARLGWDGYNTAKISNGGGIFRRDAKVIHLPVAAQKLLGLGKAVRPDDVIQAILKLDVDVLWNGGIGTYIKASFEGNSDANDRANDAVRVDGKDVRAKVIGEGGNLGVTPKGRVEMALRGIKLNTDALDNSAGVDTSDHEVNIKILLESAKAAGKLSEAQRLKLLPTLTDDIARQVLGDNLLQNVALTLSENSDTPDHMDMLAWQQELVKRGILDMKEDNLPYADRLRQRPKPHYTRPELAALLAGTKAAFRERLAGHMDYNGPLMQQLLKGYFPPALVKGFGGLIAKHPLAHEIIDTQVANMVVNRCGLLMGQRLQADFGCSPRDAIAARVVAIGLLDLIPFWEEFDAVAGRLPLTVQVEAAMRWRVSIFSLAGWILTHGQPVDHRTWLEDYQAECHAMFGTLHKVLPPRLRADIAGWQKQWKAQGLPELLAARLANLSASTMVPQAALLAKRSKLPLAKVLEMFLDIGEELHLPAITRKLRTLPLDEKFSRSALYAMEREIQARQASLTEQMLAAKMAPHKWHKTCGLACQRYQTLAREFTKLAHPNLPMAAVLLGRLRELDVK